MTIPIEYWEALERLKNNTPNVLPKNSKITNNNVSLEAGKKVGSIKKSRPVFSELITAIKQLKEGQPFLGHDLQTQLRKERQLRDKYKDLYHRCLNRELMLIDRLAEMEKELKNHATVVPIRPR